MAIAGHQYDHAINDEDLSKKKNKKGRKVHENNFYYLTFFKFIFVNNLSRTLIPKFDPHSWRGKQYGHATR